MINQHNFIGLPVLKEGGNLLQASSEKDRHVCPFYGFSGRFGGLIDSEENQCALIVKSHGPCQMETSEGILIGAIVLIEKFLSVSVFPKEFRPGKISWEGISFVDWNKYVRGGERKGFYKKG